MVKIWILKFCSLKLLDFFRVQAEDFEKILNVMPVSNIDQQSAKKQMQGLANYVKNTPKEPSRIAVLIKYLNELDRRRNSDWRGTFPWLAELVN